MISFDDTEIAFKIKSNAELKRAYWLFKIIGSPTMVKVGKWSTNAALNVGLPIKGIIKKKEKRSRQKRGNIKPK